MAEPEDTPLPGDMQPPPSMIKSKKHANALNMSATHRAQKHSVHRGKIKNHRRGQPKLAARHVRSTKHLHQGKKNLITHKKAVKPVKHHKIKQLHGKQHAKHKKAK